MLPDNDTNTAGRSTSAPDLVWIEPGFALGSKPYDYQRSAVARLGIRAVIDVHGPEAGEAEAWLALGVRLDGVPTPDWVQIPITHFDRVVALASDALNSDQSVLLHCLAGINRGPTFAAAVLCRRRQIDVDRALAAVKSRRVSAKPTAEQEQSLRLWYRLRCGKPP